LISPNSLPATRRPEDVVGLHFFSPANVMPLLEVVRTDSTAPAVIKTALDLAKSLRKTAVLARVCYGFVGKSYDGRLRPRGGAHDVGGSDAASSGWRARSMGHGHGHSRGV